MGAPLGDRQRRSVAPTSWGEITVPNLIWTNSPHRCQILIGFCSSIATGHSPTDSPTRVHPFMEYPDDSDRVAVYSIVDDVRLDVEAATIREVLGPWRTDLREGKQSLE